MTPQSAKDKHSIEITSQIVAPLTDDPIKTVSVYADTNRDNIFDTGDVVVGKAHLTKDSWEAKVSVDKLPLGESLCFIAAKSKNGNKGDDSVSVDAKYITTASVRKFSAKLKLKNSKKNASELLAVSASVKSGPISQIVIGIDTNNDGMLDSGDQILYTGDGKTTKGTGPFDATPGDSCAVLAKVRDINGIWSPTGETSVKAP